MYDAASTVLAQKLSQVEGVGQASVNGGALPAVRVALDPVRLAAHGISLEQVRSAITSTNANRPLGAVEREDHYWQVGTNDQARMAADYAPLVLRWNKGNAVRLADVAEVIDSVQDVRNYGVANGRARHLAAGVQAARGQHPGGGGQGARAAAAAQGLHSPGHRHHHRLRPHAHAARLAGGGASARWRWPWRWSSWWCSCSCARARAALIPSVAVPASLVGTFGVMYLAATRWTTSRSWRSRWSPALWWTTPSWCWRTSCATWSAA